MVTCLAWFLRQRMGAALLRLPLGQLGLCVLLQLLHAAAHPEHKLPLSGVAAETRLPREAATELAVALLLSRGRVREARQFHDDSEGHRDGSTRTGALVAAYESTAAAHKPSSAPAPDLEMMQSGRAASGTVAGTFADPRLQAPPPTRAPMHVSSAGWSPARLPQSITPEPATPVPPSPTPQSLLLPASAPRAAARAVGAAVHVPASPVAAQASKHLGATPRTYAE